MRFETPQNVKDEADVIHVMTEYLNDLPMLCGRMVTEQTHGDYDPYDFDVYYRGLRVGVGEVKCRPGLTNKMLKDGWAIGNRKLKELNHICLDTLDCLLVVRTTEMYVYFVQLDHVRQGYKTGVVGPAPEWMMKRSQHGGEPIEKGTLIPFDMLKFAGIVGC